MFHAMWTTLGGGTKPADAEQPGLTPHKTLETGLNRKDLTWRIKWKGEEGTRLNTLDKVKLDGQMMDIDTIVDELMVDGDVAEEAIRKLARGWSPSTRHKFGVTEETTSEAAEILDALRFNHDIAKAVKSNDAKVPVELWDGAVCRHPPTIKQQQALSILCGLALRLYRLKLWRDAQSFLRREQGEAWTTKACISGLAGNEDANAIRDILWRSAGNNWFEYPTGFHLIFFRFPAQYRLQAKRGVRVMFSSKGPTSKRRQPPLKPETKARGEGSIAKKDHKVHGAKVLLFVARRKEELAPLTWTQEYKMQ